MLLTSAGMAELGVPGEPLTFEGYFVFIGYFRNICCSVKVEMPDNMCAFLKAHVKNRLFLLLPKTSNVLTLLSKQLGNQERASIKNITLNEGNKLNPANLL